MAASQSPRKPKRKMDEWDVSDARQSSSAIVHGVITQLSPIKKSKRDETKQYFNAQLSDGKKSLRVVSFDPKLREALDSSLVKQEAISMVNCQVKESGCVTELFLNEFSGVQSSPKKYQIKDSEFVAELAIMMKDLPSMKPKQLVTVTVKVKSVSAPEKVTNRGGREFQKQDCIVGDISGCGKVVLWEDEVGTITEGDCYKLAGASVKSFGGVSYLSVGENCKITKVNDIGQVADIEVKESGKVIEGEIDAIMYSEEYDGCFICKAKVHSDDNITGTCSKCGALMKLNKCSKYATAQVAITTKDKVHRLTLFHEVIMSIIQLEGISGQSIAQKLLSAPPLQLNVDHKDVVLTVNKL